MINPAKRTKSIELSQVRKMFEITNPDAINLGIGEPDFDVPENIKEAMKKYRESVNLIYDRYRQGDMGQQTVHSNTVVEEEAVF